jgi:hypothetical protein
VYLSSFSKTVAPGFPRCMDRGGAGARRAARESPSSRPISAPVRSISGFVYEIWRQGVLEQPLSLLRAAYQRKRTVLETALRREARPPRHLAGTEGRIVPLGVIRQRDRHRCAAEPGHRPRRRVRTGQCVLRRAPARQPGAAVVFRPAAGANRGGGVRLAAAVREELEVRGRSGQEPPAGLAAPRTASESRSRE